MGRVLTRMPSSFMAEDVPEQDEEEVHEFGHMSLLHSPHLDANVSQEKESAAKIQSPRSPAFTRSWTFHQSERKVPQLSPITRRPPRLDCSKVYNRSQSWSLTKTIVLTKKPSFRGVEVPETIVAGCSSSEEEEEKKIMHVPEEAKPEPRMPTDGNGEELGCGELVEATVSPRNPYAIPDWTIEEEEDEKTPIVKAYRVKPLARSFIVPATPTKQHWMSLSNLDRVVNPTFSSVIHYYKDSVTETRSFSDLTKILKESLAKTLVDFFPLAGRLSLRDDGKVDLHCNDAGAVWIEAAVDEKLDDIGGAQPNHRFSGLDVARVGQGPIYIPDQLTPMPTLIIQVTKFACGAIAIGTSWHHTVADGFSGTHFMRSWAETSQGKELSLPPIHDRTILDPREPPNPTLVNGYSKGPAGTWLGTGTEEAKVRTDAPAKLESFDLGPKAIADLKIQANMAPPPFTPRPYTSAESISAHLWRQMTKARASANLYDSDVAREQATKFFMFVDGRKKLKLPGGYFGNVVCSACAVAREGDILDNPLHYAASLIRIATRNITAEYFRSLIDWVELQGMSGSKSDHVNSLGHDVAATFWTFFPLYEIEFGFGKPVFAARNSPPRPLIDGIAMMPSSEGRGMVALLNLHADRMSKLQRQISFATIFHS